MGISERTLIGTIIPKTATGDKAPVLFADQPPKLFAGLSAVLGSLVVDYAVRQRATNIKFFVLEQAPVLLPEQLSQMAIWLGTAPVEWFAPRLLELCYTNVEIEPFARDLNFEGEPFNWDVDRRQLIQAEIDAATRPEAVGVDRRSDAAHPEGGEPRRFLPLSCHRRACPRWIAQGLPEVEGPSGDGCAYP